MVGEEVGQSGQIERRTRTQRWQQRLDLGPENERAIGLMHVIQGLHAVAVAGEKESTLDLVPDRDGEHAAHALDRPLSEALVEVQHGLGVRACSIVHPRRLEFGLEHRVIEDLAVVDDHETLVVAVHRLLAVGHIDDTESSMAEAHPRPNVQAGPIGPPVGDGIAHALEEAPVRASARVHIHYPADSAHENYFLAAHWIWASSLSCRQSPARAALETKEGAVPTPQRDRTTLQKAQRLSPPLQSLRQARSGVHRLHLLRAGHRNSAPVVLTGPSISCVCSY